GPSGPHNHQASRSKSKIKAEPFFPQEKKRPEGGLDFRFAPASANPVAFPRRMLFNHPMASEKGQALKTLLLWGIFHVVIFTVVEEYFGTFWGLIAGLVWGVGEILHEKIRYDRVETMTWIGNGVLLLLGGVSLFTAEGVWFKLQPAILEIVTGGML